MPEAYLTAPPLVGVAQGPGALAGGVIWPRKAGLGVGHLVVQVDPQAEVSQRCGQQLQLASLSVKDGQSQRARKRPCCLLIDEVITSTSSRHFPDRPEWPLA